MKNLNQYVLCLVKGGRWSMDNLTLYFTDYTLDKQWGDDWDDKPYEHNASEPYTEDTSINLNKQGDIPIYQQIDIIKVIVCPQGGYLSTPCTGTDNSIYSVKDINNKKVPWITIDLLDDTKPTLIWAGTTLEDFLHTMESFEDIEVFVDFNKFAKPFIHTGLRVQNTRDDTVGIILREHTKTGQIQVLEKIQPLVINTHDKWNTLKIID